MARNLNTSIIEEVFNDLGDIDLESKVYKQIEDNLRFECRDRRYDLFVKAGTNRSTIFTFMKVKYYVYFDYSVNKWIAEYNNR